MSNKLSLHHIGGRNGQGSFPALKYFEKDIINVLYDADKDCLEHIKESNWASNSELHILPYCLAGAKGRALFNLNYDPYTSSLLKTNNGMRQHYYFNENSDYVWGEVSKTMESFELEVSTLDSILSGRSDIPKPDFLSLDTQGSEYDILLGAKDLLRDNILGVALEVEFKELYDQQYLFGDIEKLLLSWGFEFIRFLKFGEFSPYRAPLGLRAGQDQVFADVLFLKRDDTIGSKTTADYLKLKKLAFLSIAFNQLERGLLYLSKSAGIIISPEIKDALSGSSYFRFLDELERQIGLMKKQYPVTFTSLYTFEKSKSRFASAAQKAKAGIPDKLVQILRKNSFLRKVLRSVRDSLRNSLDWFTCKVRPHFSLNTPLEKLFRKYGLRELAKIVKLNRIHQFARSRLSDSK